MIITMAHKPGQGEFPPPEIVCRRGIIVLSKMQRTNPKADLTREKEPKSCNTKVRVG